jgi:hypothetical protein
LDEGDQYSEDLAFDVFLWSEDLVVGFAFVLLEDVRDAVLVLGEDYFDADDVEVAEDAADLGVGRVEPELRRDDL